MILNEATAQEVNKILTHFIIENNHVVGIKDYTLKLILIFIGITILLTLISCIIVHICRRDVFDFMKVAYNYITSAIVITICGLSFIPCYMTIEPMVCNKYDKIYQESVEIISNSTEKIALEKIYINNTSDTEKLGEKPENNKEYTCITLNENNEIKNIKIPYDKSTLIKNETPYIEIVYDNVKYLNDDTEQVIKSATIYVTKDMINDITE